LVDPTVNNETNNNSNNNLATTSSSFFNISNSTNKELGHNIRQEIEILANEFIRLDDQERAIRRDKKSLILEMADKFERLHEINEFPYPIHRIGSYLYKFLQRKGFDVSEVYIWKVLRDNAPQYLNSSYQEINSKDIDIKLYQQEILDAAEKMANIRYDLLKKEQIQDLLTKQYESLDSIEDYADKNNIITVPSGQQIEQVPHYDAQDLDPFKDPIYTDVPDLQQNQKPSTLALETKDLGKAIRECGSTIESTGEMMEKYPPDPNDTEMEVEAVKEVREWKQFWILLRQGLKGGTDRKYRRSIIQWVKIAQDENDWGKHAASSKNPYVARFIDPKTGAWKEEIRKLTREQIGDVSPKVREFALLFRRSVPACFKFIKWSEIYLHPFTNGLSTKLSDKLSDRSLR
jgi:hypothetical protein